MQIFFVMKFTGSINVKYMLNVTIDDYVYIIRYGTGTFIKTFARKKNYIFIILLNVSKILKMM